MRAAHFPPARNVLAAHLTLFHALDGDQEAAIMADLAAASTAETSFAIEATGLQPLGYGVAITVRSARLATLRADLARRWAPMLTAQDRQSFRPHVTIQNKVPAAQARALLAALQPDFAPFPIQATGLALWRYLGGPWSKRAMLPFASSPIEQPGTGQVPDQ